MSADSSGETTQTELTAVMELIGDLVRKSDGGNFIFRGERKVYERVSSSLWRLYKEIEAEGFDIEVVQPKSSMKLGLIQDTRERLKTWKFCHNSSTTVVPRILSTLPLIT